MNKSFDFYFDFISPYAFIAHNKIKKIEKDYMFKINYQPILLGGLHNLHEIKAPAFIPSKAKFMIRDCKMVAEKNKINFKFNSYFPIKSLNLMRGVFVAAEDGKSKITGVEPDATSKSSKPSLAAPETNI